MQRITQCLWFDRNAEEAINFYIDTFKNSPLKDGKNSEIKTMQYYPENIQEGPMKGFEGKVLTGIFTLAGQQFMALDGGPAFKFTEAISLYVECETQEEIDYFWEKFSAVPESEQCGWLKDKYGLSWQIAPKQLGNFMLDSNKEKVARVTDAFMQMKKFDIAKLQAAFDEK